MKDNSYQVYLEELKSIRAADDREIGELLQIIAAGPPKADRAEQARTRLIEGMQHFIAELAQKQKAADVAISDLVQEANMALLLVLSEYGQGTGLMDADEEARIFRSEVSSRAETLMAELIDAQKEQAVVHEELIARINVLQKVSQFLAAELKREPTVTELAEKMKMTEDEIRAIMKETLAAMSVSPEAADAEEQEALEDLASIARETLSSEFPPKSNRE